MYKVNENTIHVPSTVNFPEQLTQTSPPKTCKSDPEPSGKVHDQTFPFISPANMYRPGLGMWMLVRTDEELVSS